MRLYRRGDVWWADFWHQGKRVRRSSGTADEVAANEWADTLKAGLWREAKLGERRSVSWDEAVIAWLAEKERDGKASIADDKDRLRELSKEFKGRPLEAVTTSALKAIVNGLSKDRANGTVNRHLAAASAILHFARDHEWLPAVPKIPYLKEPRRRIRYLKNEKEADGLLSELPAHVRAMVRFALATGLRRHNVTHLEWESVDLRRRIVWYHPDEMKAGKALSCPLNADALEVLRERKADPKGHARWVFPYRGEPVHDVTTRAWHEACARAGVHDFTFHDLRHTWASWHVQRGTPLEVLQELGGWESFEMVRKYAHLGRSHVAQWAGNVERNRRKSGTAKKRTARKAA